MSVRGVSGSLVSAVAIDSLPDGSSNVTSSDLLPIEHDPTNTKVVEKLPISALFSIYVKSQSDQRTFETSLSANGAVFNGTSDDAPGIQAALNSIGSDNKFHRVALPAGGLTGVIGSVNSCSYADPLASSPPNAGIVIPVNVAVDFNMATLQVNAAGATAIGSSGTAVGLAGNSNLASAFPVHMCAWERGTILAGGVGWALFLGNSSTHDRGPDRATFRLLRLSNGLSGVNLGDLSYLNRFVYCYISATTNNDLFCNNTGGGENYCFVGCTFDKESTGSSVIALLAQSVANFNFHGCSFDYLQGAFYLNAGSAAININAFGCHFEFDKLNPNWTSSLAYLRIASNANAPQAINLYGGEIVQKATGSGTQLSQFARSGVTGVAAPYGITLRDVQRSLQTGTSLYLDSDTGRIVDDGGPDTISPATLASGTTNDYAPTSLATSKVVRITPAAGGSSLSGIKFIPNARITLVNIGGGDDLTLLNANVGSAAGNRFKFAGGNNVTIPQDGSFTILSDGTSSLWRSATP